MDAETLYSKQQVEVMVPAPRSTLALWISQGRFPRSFHVAGSRQAFFLKREVDEWLRAHVLVEQQSALPQGQM